MTIGVSTGIFRARRKRSAVRSPHGRAAALQLRPIRRRRSSGARRRNRRAAAASRVAWRDLVSRRYDGTAPICVINPMVSPTPQCSTHLPFKPDYVDHLDLDPSLRRLDAHEFASVSPDEPGARPYLVTVGGDVLDVTLKLGEAGFDLEDEVFEAIAPRRRSR